MYDQFRSPGKLFQEICETKPVTMDGLDIPEFRILLLGQVGAGKSSFYNTISSIFRGYVTSLAITGQSGHSITSIFRVYDVQSSPTAPPLKWKICDTVGLLPNCGLSLNELLYMVDGNIPNRFQFSPYGRVTPDSPGFIECPSYSQRAHCVALVIDASTVNSMAEEMWEKYRALQDALNARRIPLVVLLTKIDVACPQTRTNIMHVFHSDILQNRVRLISHKLQGLPANKIFPIKNYEWETELTMNVNNLSLLALRQMLRFAQDHVEDRADHLRMTGGLRRRLGMREILCLLFLLAMVMVFFLHCSGKIQFAGKVERGEEELYE
ncbi:predicted protein [Nematostella vectensis]|uniref:G domain-containing protein n=1 Tax=Nematostella vectensis TaxID=45351 RepID=A7RLH3_NEMVE|nr:predicted protein [Nematostella vectensis]|eukprot:XP_001639668.1 predicted protein [Nematostella vectensis]